MSQVGAPCATNSDCVRYCALIRRGITGSACCFAEKIPGARGHHFLTGSSTCYCCPWHKDASWSGTLEKDNEAACKSYLAYSVSTHSTGVTSEFCLGCQQALISATFDLASPSVCQEKKDAFNETVPFLDIDEGPNHSELVEEFNDKTNYDEFWHDAFA